MEKLDHRLDIIGEYLENDGPGRVQLFREFLSALKALSEAERPRAVQAACRAVSPELDYTSLMALKRFIGQEQGPEAAAEPVRVAVLGGPTTVQLVQLLKLFLAAGNLPCELYECEYGLFRQEILTPGSGLDEFQPQIVFIATGARDVTRFPAMTASAEAVRRMADDEFSGWAALWDLVERRWGASVVQNTFESTPWRAMGHYSLRHAASRENYLAHLNRCFAECAPAHVALHDLNYLVISSGAHAWFDPRFYLEAKMPCGPECLVPYAHSAASVILALRGKSRKVLVLDLDNTLWGGVIGDAGLQGIQLGEGSAQGEAFLEFQRYCKQLHDRGIVLAVCSKNDDEVARQPFEFRDDMVLRLEHISCFIANWNNKADNLRDISQRLELGLDSLVFVDDNPAERALVRRFLPEVAVPDMPGDPAGYVPALAKHAYFETVSWTREDASRGEYYARNAERARAAAGFEDLSSFLASLDMRAKVEPVSRLNIERVTQLVNKSNQFNLTTRRRTLAEVEKIAGEPGWHTLAISLADRLGDNGLISVIFLARRGDEMEVDTWLMSCRVLQRTVEQMALNQVVAICQAEGVSSLKGTYIPTARNGMVKEHYSKLGFEAAGSAGATTYWTLPVNRSFEPRHTYIQIEGGYERHTRKIAAGI